VDWPHPLLAVTALLAALAAILAFVAVRVAADARDAAYAADAGPSVDSSYEIAQLQTALIRAGVIEDPAIIPDDHGTVDGPWARCLTAEERTELAPDESDVELPAPCDAVTAALVEECHEPEPADDVDPEVEDVAPCQRWYEIDGRRFDFSEAAHPVDVEAVADEWLLADGSGDVTRVARGDGGTYVHVTGEGWLRLEPSVEYG
jgi:hypothetical protein